MNQRIEDMKATITMATLAALDRNGVHGTHYRDIEVVAELREEDIETINGVCKDARLTATVNYCGSEIISLATGSVTMTAEASLNNAIQDMLGRGLGRRLTTAIQRLGVVWFRRTGLAHDVAARTEVAVVEETAEQVTQQVNEMFDRAEERIADVEEVEVVEQVFTVVTHQGIVDRIEATRAEGKAWVDRWASHYMQDPVLRNASFDYQIEHGIIEVTTADGYVLSVDKPATFQAEIWEEVEADLLRELRYQKLEELMENVGYHMSGRAGNALMSSLYRIAGDYDFSGDMPTIHYDRVTHIIYIRHWGQNHELVKLDAGVSPDKWALDGRRNWRALKGFMADLRARDRVGAVEHLSEFYTVNDGDTEEELRGYLLSRLGTEGEIDFEDEEANLREGDEHEIANNVARFKEIAQTITEDEIEEATLARWQETVRISEFWRQAGERIENGEPAGEVFGGIFGIGQQPSTEPF